MNESDSSERVLRALRNRPPDCNRIELGFETRFLARLRAEREREQRWIWLPFRVAALAAVAVAVLASWHWVEPPEDDQLLGLLAADRSPLLAEWSGAEEE